MKKLLFLFGSILTIHTLSIAQITFSKIYEKSRLGYPWDVCETSDKGFIIVGQIWSDINHNNVYLVKTDQYGDTLWTKSIGGTGDEYGHSVKQTTDKGYIIVGQTTPFGKESYDVYLIKINEKGETTWIKTLGGTGSDWGVSLQITDDEGYIISGRTTGFGYDWGNPYLIRTNSMGEIIWSKTPSGSSPGCSVFDFCVTTDGGYLIAGNTFGFNEGEAGHVFLVKTDSKGDKIWDKIYNNYTNNVGVSVKETPDGGYVLSGVSYQAIPGNPYACVIELTKTDKLGTLLWKKTFSEGGYTFGHSVDNTIDGGFIISGKAINQKNNNTEVYLIKTNALGVTQWTKFYESLGNGYPGVIVKQSSDGGFMITGNAEGPYTQSNVFLIKTDKNGKTSGIANSLSEKRGNGILVYPTLADDVVTILRETGSKILVEIIDIHGRVIYHEEKTDNPVRINTSKYSPGSYVLKVSSGSKITTKLIVKRN